MKATVLVNRESGLSDADERRLEGEVRAAFEAVGVDADVRLVLGESLADEARAALARRVDVVVAAGGDGTMNAIASVLAGRDTPMGILPRGTLNHFAKDLGIPLDLASAARVIAEGRIVAVDVGRVDDRIFLNNSSLGVYARALVQRDAQRRRFGMKKWTAMALAVLKTFRRSPMLQVRLVTGEQSNVRKAPLVFIGNNHYQLDLFNVGRRARLDQGKLSLYVVNTATRWRFIKLVFRAAVGRLRQSRDFDQESVTELRIETRRSRLHVALDGEITRLKPPLEYRIWPAALRVIVPTAPDASPTSSTESL